MEDQVNVSPEHKINEKNGGIFLFKLPDDSLYTAFILRWLYDGQPCKDHFFSSLVWAYLLIGICVQVSFASVYALRICVGDDANTGCVGASDSPEPRDIDSIHFIQWTGLVVLAAKFTASAFETWSMVRWLFCFKFSGWLLPNPNPNPPLTVDKKKMTYKSNKWNDTEFQVCRPHTTLNCFEILFGYILLIIKFGVTLWVFWIGSTAILLVAEEKVPVNSVESWFLLEISDILGKAFLTGTNLGNTSSYSSNGNGLLVFGQLPHKMPHKPHKMPDKQGNQNVYRRERDRNPKYEATPSWMYWYSRISRVVALVGFVLLGFGGHRAVLAIMSQ